MTRRKQDFAEGIDDVTTRLTAEVIVVGAGAIGAATAYFLAREQGISDVVLLDKDGPAAGASGRTGALVRMHYTNPHDATLALKSLEMFANWPEAVGGDCGFKKTGFLCLVSPTDVDGLQRNTDMLKSVGINSFGPLTAAWRTISVVAISPSSPCTGY